MEKLRESLMKGNLSFAFALALVMGAVPLDGFVSIVQAADKSGDEPRKTEAAFAAVSTENSEEDEYR